MYIYKLFKNAHLVHIWIQKNISSAPALSKIINNDTKDIISTPAMKLSIDPDARDLKLISSSLIWEIESTSLLLHAPWALGC